MITTEPTMPVPLHVDEQGDIRVGDTRLLLDIVVYAYRGGLTPEDIAARYAGGDQRRRRLSPPTQANIDACIARREEDGERMRAEAEASPACRKVVERIKAMRAQQVGG